MSLSILLPILVCFHRKRVYVTWAKIASLMACIAGLGWGFLGLALSYSSIAGLDYSRIEGIKGMLGGICIGFVLSIIIARPYEKRVV
jgi:hypothetical protein